MRNLDDDQTVYIMRKVSRLAQKSIALYDAGEPERAYFLQSEATSLAMAEIDRLANLLDTLTEIDNEPESQPCVATSRVVPLAGRGMN